MSDAREVDFEIVVSKHDKRQAGGEKKCSSTSLFIVYQDTCTFLSDIVSPRNSWAQVSFNPFVCSLSRTPFSLSTWRVAMDAGTRLAK